jgi:hypothetical protein
MSRFAKCNVAGGPRSGGFAGEPQVTNGGWHSKRR